ncbi:MAG: hypothetical protein ACUVS7_03335 [Bryobacteraceae bacterium]
MGGLGGAVGAAQPSLGPCIASSAQAGGQRLVFRAPVPPPPRRARVVLLLHMRGEAPARVLLNGKRAPIASRARGWAAVPIPPGVRWERITVEPGGPFEGCTDPGRAPYLVFEPGPRAK